MKVSWKMSLAGLVIMLASGAVNSGETDLVEKLKRIAPSVGALYSRTSSGDMKFLCSVTAIARHGNKTVVMTANHCLTKGVSYIANFGSGMMIPLAVWKIPHYEADKEDERKYNEPETDMALFLMDGVDIPIIRMSTDSAFMETGRRVVMVGFPLGVAKISYEGIIAGRFSMPGGDQDGYLMLQIFGAPGSSGSSVIDLETGEIIGALVSAKQSNIGLPVIFATPVEYSKHLSMIRKEEVGSKNVAANR